MLWTKQAEKGSFLAVFILLDDYVGAYNIWLLTQKILHEMKRQKQQKRNTQWQNHTRDKRKKINASYLACSFFCLRMRLCCMLYLVRCEFAACETLAPQYKLSFLNTYSTQSLLYPQIKSIQWDLNAKECAKLVYETEKEADDGEKETDKVYGT